MNSRSSPQRIVRIRRAYNRWVGDETLEDYALRFTARSFRKWSEMRIANTALGGISFLALEAIGAVLMVRYGFTTTASAIATVCCMIFALSLPIAYYAARYGVDIDLLTRGAGFGYLGSTITSLIYAGFTFLFFALEAAIMGQAIAMYFGIPLSLAYLLSSVAIIPLVIHGVTAINRLQAWTQPLWLILLVLPYLCVAWQRPEAFIDFGGFTGRQHDGSFAWAAFGAACGVALSLVAQIGEQVDYLRFLPKKRVENRSRWWLAVIMAGPGWVVLGGLKMCGGALLAFLALQHELPWAQAVEPTHMYQVAFGYVFDSPGLVLAATVLFVVLSQVKINVTNAYAGSLAWSNFFSRVTRSHPGRVVWLVFNVLIALILLEVGVFTAIESVLGLYANLAAAWIGALAADLVVNKPLGLSPRGIEFKRGHLYDINPVGIGSLALAGGAALVAYSGLLGSEARAAAPAVALGGAFVSAIAIASLTRGRFYLARQPASRETLAPQQCNDVMCVLCHNDFEPDDMAICPAYTGTICSLCCSLDMRCGDVCRPGAHFSFQRRALLQRLLPGSIFPALYTRLSVYALVLGALSLVLAGVLVTVYAQVAPLLVDNDTNALFDIFMRTFLLLSALTAMLSWWVVLTRESRAVAQEETSHQTELLMREIQAHEKTDAELQRAKSEAEAANRAKSRYVSSLSHELRTPLNNVLGYTQLLRRDKHFDDVQRERLDIIQRSGEHLLALVDGLLDIARIEAGRISLEIGEIDMQELMSQLDAMFAPQAETRGLDFRIEWQGRVPQRVRGDEQRLRQVLINLLSNALRFTRKGSVRLCVAYGWEIATFDVIDTGPGIDPARLEEIFLPFERLDVASHADTVGTGLGLTICQLLAHLMGGELTVRPGVDGIGSHFTLRVFLARVAPSSARPRMISKGVCCSALQRRALVVDDMPDQRALLSDVLKPLGFEVATCTDGPSALRFLAGEHVDLIVMDVGMPAMDGFEVSRLIRARCFSDAPILVVSANAYGEDVARSEAVGCDAWLSKPIDLVALEEKVVMLLQNASQTGAAKETGTAAIIATDIPAPSHSAPVVEADLARLRARLLAAADAGVVAGIEAVLDDIEKVYPLAGKTLEDMRRAARRFDFSHLARIARELDIRSPEWAGREDNEA